MSTGYHKVAQQTSLVQFFTAKYVQCNRRFIVTLTCCWSAAQP